jgi:hypothetical protein
MTLQGKNAPLTRGGRDTGLARVRGAEGVARSGRLFFLEMSRDRIHSMNPELAGVSVSGGHTHSDCEIVRQPERVGLRLACRCTTTPAKKV